MLILPYFSVVPCFLLPSLTTLSFTNIQRGFHLSIGCWNSFEFTLVLVYCALRLAHLKFSRNFDSRPIRGKTKTLKQKHSHVFPRLVSDTCNCFKFWLVHWFASVLCDWPRWFWFADPEPRSKERQTYPSKVHHTRSERRSWSQQILHKSSCHLKYTSHFPYCVLLQQLVKNES